MNDVERFHKLLDTLEDHIEYITGICDVFVKFVLPDSKSQVKELTFSVNNWLTGKQEYTLEILKPIPHTHESSIVIAEEIDKDYFTEFRYRILQLEKEFRRFHLNELDEFLDNL
jgi:hypothetical protein